MTALTLGPVETRGARAAAVARARCCDPRRRSSPLAPGWCHDWPGERSAIAPSRYALILALDWFLVRGAHALLSGLLPDALSLYLAGSYAVLLATLLGLTYAAVPLLAARQLRPPLEEHHA